MHAAPAAHSNIMFCMLSLAVRLYFWKVQCVLLLHHNTVSIQAHNAECLCLQCGQKVTVNIATAAQHNQHAELSTLTVYVCSVGRR